MKRGMLLQGLRGLRRALTQAGEELELPKVSVNAHEGSGAEKAECRWVSSVRSSISLLRWFSNLNGRGFTNKQDRASMI